MIILAAPMTSPAAVEVRRASAEEQPIVRKLLQAYLVEFAALEGVGPVLDDDGRPLYQWFEAYWTESSRYPLVILADGEIVGFCLLRDTGELWEIAEFSVDPSWRQQGVGAAAVDAIKELCRASGRHGVVRAKTMLSHDQALSFWRRQGFVTTAEDAEQRSNVARL